jgi:hypothetical protein
MKYQYAKSKNKSYVDVTKLNHENRNKWAPYYCFGCGNELIPNLGEKKIKHFSHKTTCECSKETYLHQLAKNIFFSKYNECLINNKPFLYIRPINQLCTYMQNFTGETCTKTVEEKIDLTKYFKNLIMEKKFNGFIPDILLYSTTKSEVLFIEIAVTHQCEEKKITSGNRILEINIRDENDILQISNAEIFEHSENIKTYNFKQKDFIRYTCSGDCDRNIYIFMVYKSKKSILKTLPLKEALTTPYPIYKEILGFSEKNENLYKDKVREAYFKNISIQNCYLCKYYGEKLYFNEFDEFEQNNIFCKLHKKSLHPNIATECKNFSPFKSMKECIQADIKNEEYYKKEKNSCKLIL